MTASVEAGAIPHKRPRGRPPSPPSPDPLLPGFIVHMPSKMLDDVRVFLRERWTHDSVGLVGGLRQLIGEALDEHKRQARGGHRTFDFEPFPEEEFKNTRRILLRLPASMSAGVTKYQHKRMLSANTTAVRDLVWNGLRLWRCRKDQDPIR